MTQYAITKLGSHGFRKGEIVTLVRIISPDTMLMKNDKDEVWAVNIKQIQKYERYESR